MVILNFNGKEETNFIYWIKNNNLEIDYIFLFHSLLFAESNCMYPPGNQIKYFKFE